MPIVTRVIIPCILSSDFSNTLQQLEEIGLDFLKRNHLKRGLFTSKPLEPVHISTQLGPRLQGIDRCNQLKFVLPPSEISFGPLWFGFGGSRCIRPNRQSRFSNREQVARSKRVRGDQDLLRAIFGHCFNPFSKFP